MLNLGGHVDEDICLVFKCLYIDCLLVAKRKKVTVPVEKSWNAKSEYNHEKTSPQMKDILAKKKVEVVDAIILQCQCHKRQSKAKEHPRSKDTKET